jgi:GT2 family glycosyltransferase
MIREAVVVDNGYPEMGDARTIISPAAYPFKVHFCQHHGHSYARSINLGAAACDGPILILSNNDVEWLPGFSMAPAVEEVQRNPDVGVAGPQLVFPDGRWQRSAGPFPSLFEATRSMLLVGVIENRLAALRHSLGSQPGPVREVDYVDGACMVTSRACFEQLRGFDTDSDFYAEDADFSWRAKLNGWRRVIVPSARVMHIRGASSSAIARKAYGKRLLVAKRRLVEKMGGKSQAAWYDRLQRAAAFEYAILYALVDAMWRTPASQRRAHWARGLALAALEDGRPR